jgi:ketosteroid isomerase-like protein
MSTSSDSFDPLAVVVDWLDACRLAKLDDLLDLYDERATLECNCEQVSLTGREAIAAYWAPKLERRIHCCVRAQTAHADVATVTQIVRRPPA